MKHLKLLIFCFGILSANTASAQNPIIRNQFTADPTARVFNDKVYVYPSHDILAPAEATHLKKDWFCMEDYHVFSSENLTDWTDHGMILNQTTVAWTDPTTYTMWAPDCYEKNGKYYFYFPAIKKDASNDKERAIGVAVSDEPYGPFIPELKPIEGILGIDPNVFIDKNGQAYIYWAAGSKLYGAKLNENMLDLASEPQVFNGFPKGFKEGPFMFERKGVYYFTFPHVIEKTEALAYAVGNDPLGPFDYKGLIMEESPVGCWTNHQSIIEYKKQWYLFYHHNDYSPNFDKNRSVTIDSLFFKADGTIQKVTPTIRGVGVTNASDNIQIDRYSHISDKGVSIAFNDTSNTFKGWKVVFAAKNSWIKYNAVDFENDEYKTVEIRVASKLEGNLQLNFDSIDGPLVANINIAKGNEWQIIKTPVAELKPGVHNLVISSKDDNLVEIDWIRFN